MLSCVGEKTWQVKDSYDLENFHRIIEWFGLEETLKIIWFQPPAMGRDNFH